MVNGQLVEGHVMIVIAQCAADEVAATEEAEAEHNKDGQEIHEGDLVVMSKQCDGQGCDRKRYVRLQRNFNQVLQCLAERISQIQVKLEIVEIRLAL